MVLMDIKKNLNKKYFISKIFLMITKENKLKLTLITLFLDLVLLFIFLNYPLSTNDTFFIIFIFILHFLFFLSLSFSYYRFIDILHIFMFLSIVYVFFLDSIHLQYLILFLLVMIQCLWIHEKTCIMNTSESPFSPFSKKCFTSFTLCFSVFLSYLLGFHSSYIFP